ncbi:MAG: hypothetical protein AAFO84_07030 [Cyanobacteria bacterium J06598_1]
MNSLCHKFGTQPFQSKDSSRNNSFVAFLTLGEGWHNLHHAFPWSVRQGITLKNNKVQYLPDPTFWFIQCLQRVGLASKLKEPSRKALLNASTR